MADEVSFNDQLRQLKSGQSISRAERFPITEAADVAEALDRMRRNLNAIVSRIRSSSGSNFRVESATVLTDDKQAIFAFVAATRI